MIRVKNRKIIAKLSRKSLKASRVRNLIAVFAIVLTTMLFMALFTIAGTMVHTFQQQTFRQVGTYGHGAFKNLTQEEKEILAQDSRIKECGGRLMLGMGSGEKFRKIHAEFSYMEPVYRRVCFCEPEHGRAPEEGTKEIICDTRILKCLGVEPRIGAPLTITYEIGGADKTTITDTFLLSGWWEYDPAGMASMAVLPKSYVDEIIQQYPQDREDRSNYTGIWDLEILLDSSMHIEEDLEKILNNAGYQSTDSHAKHYISVGVNWAYAGAQLSASADPEMVFGIILMLVLIVFTGYLIIYNIFQISVSADIRFYGLLKTVGTTGKQIRKMIRRQALWLSAVGIPIGLAAGCLAGMVLAPVILSTYSVGRAYQTMSPWYFVVAALFSVVTVLISCAKPGRIAARVSPIEAVRYTDAAPGRKQHKKGRAGGKPFRMAQANLGRNKKKTVLVAASMALAVVLLQLTYTLANGFDMDKYLQKWVVSDFILGDASYFQSYPDYSVPFPAVAQADIDNLAQGGEITQSGNIYGHQGGISVYTTEEDYRNYFRGWEYSEDELDAMMQAQEKDASGRIAAGVQLYGMDDYPLSQMQVIDGDLADLFDPDKRAIAAVYRGDDYEKPIESSQWAKVGDMVTLHYVYAWEYFDDETGEQLTEEEARNSDRPVTAEEKEGADVTYEVAACVMIKNAMSYRYTGNFEYVLHTQNFQKDSRTSDVMIHLFNTTPESNASMERFLEDYTNEENPSLDYESKQGYVEQFEEFRNMYLLMGGALSFVVGAVGILNFFNAVLTSIHSRRREFAMLQSIGMTGRQLKKMLILEGLLYGGIAVAASLACSLLLTPVMGNVIGGMFWFFTYRFSLLPILVVIPVFAAFGLLLPLISYRNVAKQTIVERLRESE